MFWDFCWAEKYVHTKERRVTTTYKKIGFLCAVATLLSFFFGVCHPPPLIVLSPSIKQKIKKVHYLYAKISITIHRLTFDEEITLAWADTQTNPPQHIKITPHT